MSCLERLPRLHSLSWCKWFFCVIYYLVYTNCTLHIYDISLFSSLNVLFRKTALFALLSWFSGCSVLSTILSTQTVLFILTMSVDFPTQCLVPKDCPACIEFLCLSGCSLLSTILSKQTVLLILTISVDFPN